MIHTSDLFVSNARGKSWYLIQVKYILSKCLASKCFDFKTGFLNICICVRFPGNDIMFHMYESYMYNPTVTFYSILIT